MFKKKIRKSKGTREHERWLCIHFSMKGYSVPEIAILLFRNEDTIRDWIVSFNKEGEKGIERVSPLGSEKKNI